MICFYSLIATACCMCMMFASSADTAFAQNDTNTAVMTPITFSSANATLNRAFRIAFGDVCGNILPFDRPGPVQGKPVLMAGLDYNFPWTRDAAINTWNGIGLMFPEIARNTLLAVLEEKEGHLEIGDQYWDAIVWATGAWNYYLYSGDREFLETAYQASCNTLDRFEKEEFSADLGLFRGPAATSDGIAGYPDLYADTQGHTCILDWVRFHPDKKHPVGFGIPMHALSTNCLYYNAYRVLPRMANALDKEADSSWETKGTALRDAINTHFWNTETNTYRYLVDPLTGNCDRQECLGNGYVMLFHIADDNRVEQVIKNQPWLPAGIPVVWPQFERYDNEADTDFGRHCGCVWPPFQTLWAAGAHERGYPELLVKILNRLAENIVRDIQCTEIYHPMTGEPYGGLQETGDDPRHLWNSTQRQTWTGTALMRMIYFGILGMRFEEDGLRFQPYVPEAYANSRLQGLRYHDATLDIAIIGHGKEIESVVINGKKTQEAYIPADAKGAQKVELHVR